MRDKYLASGNCTYLPKGHTCGSQDPRAGRVPAEIGTTGTAVAIGNAVYHARRGIRDLPIIPATLLA